MSDFVSAAPPSTGTGLRLADHLGKLLIIQPTSFEAAVTTVHGPADAIKGDVYVLTGPDTADEFTDAFIWGKFLVSQLKGQIGNKVVGRLTQGVAQPGKNAPYLLDAATPEDIEKAKAFLAKTTPVVSTPQAQAPF